MTLAGAGSRGDEGALAAVLPVATGAVWTDDDALGVHLRGSGLRTDGSGPEVAVLTDMSSARAAPATAVTVLLLDGGRRGRLDGGRLGDAVGRLRAHASLLRDVRRAQRALTDRGHDDVRTLLWDRNCPLEDVSVRRGAVALHRPERYPRRAVVVGGELGETVLEAVLAAAGRECGQGPLPVIAAPTVSPGGTLLVTTPRGLLRVGVGRGRQQVATPASVLAALSRAPAGVFPQARPPQLLAQGTVGAAAWSLEQLMPGSSASSPLTQDLMRDCVDFLVALHGVHGLSPGTAAEVTAAAAPVLHSTVRAAQVERLTRQADQTLRDLPRGFGHGDFWYSNLLVERGRLTAVVDWDSAAVGRLPFLDLFHLLTSEAQRPGPYSWGPALVEDLLPWTDGGGDAHARRYGAALGIVVDQPLLRALVTAYWVDWVAYQLTSYAQRSADQRWLQANVERVLDALAQR